MAGPLDKVTLRKKKSKGRLNDAPDDTTLPKITAESSHQEEPPPEFEVIAERIQSNRRETFSLAPDERDEDDEPGLDTIENLDWWNINNPQAVVNGMHQL